MVEESIRAAGLTADKPKPIPSDRPSIEISPLILGRKVGKMDKQIVADFMTQLKSEISLPNPALTELRDALLKLNSSDAAPIKPTIDESKLRNMPPAARALLARRDSMQPRQIHPSKKDELSVFLDAVSALSTEAKTGLISVIDNLVKRSENKLGRKKAG